MNTTTTKGTDMSTTTRPNRYATECLICGRTVAPGAGILAGRQVGTRRWLVRHTTCPKPAAMPTNRPVSRAPRSTSAHRYVGMTWAQVLETNEYFDGEPEVTEAAHREWVAANVEAGTATDTDLRRWVDTDTHWGDANEAIMHAMEARHFHGEA